MGIDRIKQRKEKSDSISPRFQTTAISVPFPGVAEDRVFTAFLRLYVRSGGIFSGNIRSGGENAAVIFRSAVVCKSPGGIWRH
jgi:hypothetical protein